MFRRAFMFFCLLAVVNAAPAQEPAATPAAPVPSPAASDGRQRVVYVIPVQDQIAKPVLYILRRGLKEAIEQKAEVVLLDMNTPGGDAGTTIEIMEALNKFSGTTLTYVNDEAGSAGAIIASITDDIYFSPTGVMGAAELVMGTGEDVPEAMKRKMESYIRAKTRALSGGPERRADVLKAMMNAEFELKIGEEVIKPKGELLTLSAKEAVKAYGEPAQPLLAAGVEPDIEAVLTSRFGAGNYVIKRFEVTWSEKLAQYLTALAPILMGLGMLALFVEFKTPGFGWPGIVGIVLMGVVFLGHYVAGFSGHEPVLLFALGLLLVAVELFFFPGMVLPGVAGAAMILGSLIWAMADIWPHEPVRFSRDLFLGPIQNLGLALVITAVLAMAVLRYLPRAWFWDKMVLASAVGGNAAPIPAMETTVPAPGAEGVAVTPMFPSGEIEVAGKRYEARLAVGHVPAGTPVVVTGRDGFALTVEPKASA
jgi:membrane-bound serine protease (ClpP class)